MSLGFDGTKKRLEQFTLDEKKLTKKWKTLKKKEYY